MGSDHDEGALFGFTGSLIRPKPVLIDRLPARRDEEVRIKDGHDIEHAIEMSD